MPHHAPTPSDLALDAMARAREARRASLSLEDRIAVLERDIAAITEALRRMGMLNSP